MNKILLTLFTIAVLSFAALAQQSSKTVRKAGELMSKGDMEGAAAVLTEAISKKKDLFDAYQMRAALRGMFGDFSGALNDLSAAIEIKPDDAQLYERRGFMRMNLGQDSALILKDLDAAIALGRKMESVYSLRATLRRTIGDSAGAIADYQAAIAVRPDSAQAYVGLSSIYLLDNDEQKAAAILENFVNIYESSDNKSPKVNVTGISAANPVPLPTDSPNLTRQVQGTMMIIDDKNRKQPMSPEELSALSDNVGQTVNVALIYSNLASIYLDRKEYERSLATIEKAIKIYPNDSSAIQTRGRLRAEREDYKGAIADFDTVLKIMPGASQAYLERGIARLMIGKETEAQSDFERFLKTFPSAKEMVDKRIADAKQKIEQNGNQPK